MSKIRRKTRSDKFPLTLHPTGQYCKKINGKLYYFGADKKYALEKYLNRATCLHGDQKFSTSPYISFSTSSHHGREVSGLF